MEEIPLSSTPACCRRSASLTAWLWAFVITGLFSVVMIQESTARGALSMPPTYDDVNYDLDGADYLTRFYTDRFSGLWHHFLQSPPHAPVSTVLAMLGFSLFGIQAWASVAADSIAVLFAVRLFLGAAHRLPVSRAVLLASAFVTIPFMDQMLLWFRPDMICALVTAIGILVIALTRDLPTRPGKQFQAGLLLALALWCKPTVFHLTLLLFGVAWLVAFAPLLKARHVRMPIVSGVRILATGTVLALPYYWFAGRQTVEYIRSTLGVNAAIWVKHMSLRHHALYYLTGDAGHYTLGPWVYACMALCVVAGVAEYWWPRMASRRAVLSAFAILAASYLAVTLPTFKGPHGIVFAATLICLAALSAIALTLRLSKWGGLGLCLGICVFAIAKFSWYPYADMSHPGPYAVVFGPEEIDWSHRQLHALYEACGPDAGGKRMLQLSQTYYINTASLSFEYRQHWQTPPVPSSIELTTDPATLKAGMKTADYMLAMTPDAKEVFDTLPSAAPQARAAAMKLIEATGDFDPPLSFPFQSGGAALLYKARSSFDSFDKEQGFGPIRPAEPATASPSVRWAQAAPSSLVAHGAPGARARLFVDVRTPGIPHQVMTATINGAKSAPLDIPPDDFRAYSLPFTFDSAGTASVDLHYSVPLPVIGAVWFRALAVRTPLPE